MMFQPCPACNAPDTVHADDTPDWGPIAETCECEECGAQFWIEPDADWNGDHYVDCSTVGKRIE